MRIRDLLLDLERTPMSEVADPLGGSDDPIVVDDPGLVPGTEEPETDPATVPPAAAQNTDTTERDHGPVPYSRFREVNEARRGLEEQLAPIRELEQQGYPVDDLHRLVQWETDFAQDPVNVWLATAGTIQELPDGIKQAIEEYRGQNPEQNPTPTVPSAQPPAGSEPAPTSTDEMPEWAKPLAEFVTSEKEARQQAAERAQAEAQQAAAKSVVDKMVEAWNKLDEKDNVKTPPRTMMAHIMAAARVTNTPQEALAMAREDYLASREEILSDTITPRPAAGAPRAVPGSGLGGRPAATPAPKPRTLKEASRLSQATWGAQAANDE